MNLDSFLFLGVSRNFSASIGSFQGLPAGTSEVILLSQRLALKYNTTPRCTCQHFLTSFFQFLCGGWDYPFRHRLWRCHLPQGDGFSGGGKVSDIAQRRPLGGAGERSEPEGVTSAMAVQFPVEIKSLAYRRRVRYYILYTL
mgnify:CR=1 FL=1